MNHSKIVEMQIKCAVDIEKTIRNSLQSKTTERNTMLFTRKVSKLENEINSYSYITFSNLSKS